MISSKLVSNRPPRRRWPARIVVGVLALAVACETPGDDQTTTRPDGTVRMAERLADLAGEVEAREHPYAMSRVGGEDDAAALPDDSWAARAREAREALRTGRAGEGMALLNRIFEDVAVSGEELPPGLGLAIVETTALAHLRAWTEANCVAADAVGAAPCTFPDMLSATASDQTRAASAIYISLLEGQPENLALRWLLNLSVMMSGAHPEGVPEALRIPGDDPPANSADMPRFDDVAPDLGVDVSGHAGGGVLEDLDRDGDLDLAVTSWHLTDPMRLFRNDGEAGFTDVTGEALLTGITGGLHLVQADYDNDGWIDLLVLRGAWTSYGEPNSLLRNRGDGTFEDVTEEAGLLESASSQVGAWADVDGDGWLDLFVGNESAGDRVVPSRLYRNNGDGTFSDVAAAAGLDVVGFVKGAAWGDIDNDGRPDLYVSRLNEPNLLFRNEGPGPQGTVRFTDVTDRAGVAEPLASFPTWFWDYDNDGWLDLFVSGYRGTLADIAAEHLGRAHDGETQRLYRNLGDGTFRDVTTEAGLDRVLLTMGSNFGDLDNDGWLDFHVGTGEANLQTIVPNRMFLSREGRTFDEVTAPGGFGHLGKGHAVSFGDVDGDGDQDVHVTLGGAYPSDLARNALYRNPGSDNDWVGLTLEGVESNRSAIGARIRVVVARPDGQRREIHRIVGTGSSFGANTLSAEIGLGEDARIAELEVRWPNGGVQRFGDVEPNRRYRLVEGDETLGPLGTGPAQR